jgi:hypothetical protein
MTAVAMIVAVLAAAGVLVCIGVSRVLLRGARQLLEKMMHPMGSGRDQEETKHDSGAQVKATLKLRDWFSGFHRVSECYS